MGAEERFLYVERVGRVPAGFAGQLEKEALDFYKRLGRRPEIVEIIIYENQALKLAKVIEEARELGVTVAGVHIASHEAWRGWPRIHVDYESLARLEPEDARALLYHELAHSLLHNTISSYVINLDKALADRLGDKALEAAYLASTVVKDLEVHELLFSNGFRYYVERYYRLFEKDIGEASCRDIIGVLELAKLISPCLYTGCDLERVVREDCRGKAGKILSILRETTKVIGDLSVKANFLLERLLEEAVWKE
ncbi:hypothetical protein ACSU1N_06805 [Thermogladius sp. 4427co]|uniref:hypothetical protein n=1 Tax=Thermogladius sp. 4427co TaxID=3450718 RepID=UPI003F7A3F92